MLVRANYLIKASTMDGTSIHLNKQTNIAVIITFPSEYSSVIKRIEELPSVKTKFGSQVYNATSYLSGLRVITEYTISSAVSFSNMELEF